MAYPMGESKQGYLRVDFDRRLRLEFHGSKVTTDAGFLPTENSMTLSSLPRWPGMFSATTV